jgi:hypothetical protein
MLKLTWVKREKLERHVQQTRSYDAKSGALRSFYLDLRVALDHGVIASSTSYLQETLLQQRLLWLRRGGHVQEMQTPVASLSESRLMQPSTLPGDGLARKFRSLSK